MAISAPAKAAAAHTPPPVEPGIHLFLVRVRLQRADGISTRYRVVAAVDEPSAVWHAENGEVGVLGSFASILKAPHCPLTEAALAEFTAAQQAGVIHEAA